MQKLHPKILALRSAVGSSPIKYSRTVTSAEFDLSKRGKSDGESDRLLKQYFCIWGVKDDYGMISLKGCFKKSIEERGPASKSPYKITALYMHNQANSVGLPSILEEDEIGLYAEVPVLEGIQVCDELVIRHKRGVCNNGSYGFHYIWDKMEYDDSQDAVVMKEGDLFELSFVTIGSQTGTYGVRNSQGIYVDEFLEEDTNELIKRIPRKDQLELRSLIDRHISLAKLQPLEQRQKALEDIEPKQAMSIDYNYLLKNL